MTSRNSIRRFACAMLTAIAFAGLYPTDVEAQRRKIASHAEMEAAAKKFKVGQWVEVLDWDKWEPAEVTEIDGIWVRARLLSDKEDALARPYRGTDVRGLLAAKAAKIKKDREAQAKAGEKADAEAKRFEEEKAKKAGGGAGTGAAGATTRATDKPGAAAPAEEAPLAAAPPKLNDVSLADAKTIRPTSGGKWAYVPPADSPAVKLADKPIAIPAPFPKVKDKWDRLPDQRFESAKLAGGEHSTLLLTDWTLGFGTAAAHRAEWVDLVAGKVIGNVQVPPNTTVMDLSPDGKRIVLAESSFGGRLGSRVDVYDVIDGKRLQHLTSFKPYPESDDTRWGREIEFIRFLDADNLWTCGAGGRLALWNVTNGDTKPVYVIELDRNFHGVTPEISVNAQRTVIAAKPDKGAVTLFDAKSGKVVGSLEKSDKVGPLSFDAAGRRIASSGDSLLIWDLASGKLSNAVTLQRDVRVGTGERVRMLEEPFVLIGDSLIDLTHGVAVWTYGKGGSLPAAAGHVVNLSNGLEGDRVATVLPVPHYAARARAGEITPDILLAVKPGMRASIEVDMQGISGAPGDLQQRAMKRVTEQLAANGITVVQEPQPFKVKITSAPGETKTQEFRRGLGETTSASIAAYSLGVSYTIDGKVAWSAAGGFGQQFMLSVKEGQTTQQVVDEIRANNFTFFDTVTLPAKVIRTKELLPTGSSSASSGGWKDDPLPKLPSPVAAAPAPANKPATSGDGLE